MKAQEIIEQLNILIVQHGNLPIYARLDDYEIVSSIHYEKMPNLKKEGFPQNESVIDEAFVLE